jgi:hypothetical protein
VATVADVVDVVDGAVVEGAAVVAVLLGAVVGALVGAAVVEGAVVGALVAEAAVVAVVELVLSAALWFVPPHAAARTVTATRPSTGKPKNGPTNRLLLTIVLTLGRQQGFPGGWALPGRPRRLHSRQNQRNGRPGGAEA